MEPETEWANAADPEPVAEGLGPEEAEPRPLWSRIGFEDLFGRRLPIWAGGITLAVAGVLIVRYSIGAGLLSPLVRVLSGLLFGGGLIAAAEIALRNEEKVGDVRVRQALAGAGIASLYASILVAVNLYALIGPGAAFTGLAGVTALSMALSLRLRAPSALLGLVGGLAGPAMIASAEPNIPLLSVYLALAVGGLSLLSRTQRWMWLGIAALAGGLGWGAVLLIGGALDVASSLSIGFYILLVGIAFPLLAMPLGSGGLVRIAGSIAAAAQMAALVANGGFALMHWGLFGLISIAIMWLSRREQKFERLPVVGLGIALLLLGGWPQPGVDVFALVAIGLAAIYAVPALRDLWNEGGGLVEAGQLTAVALGVAVISALQFHRPDGIANLPLAAVALAAALLPAGAALLGWRAPERHHDARFALLASAAALLSAMAAVFAGPGWSLAPVIAGIGGLLLLLSLRARDAYLERSAWIFASAALPMLAASEYLWTELARLFGEGDQTEPAMGLLRWGTLAAVAMLLAWRAQWAAGSRLAQAAAALFGYGIAAQLLPDQVLPAALGAGVLGLALADGRFAFARPRPSIATLCTLALLWAGAPLLHWLIAGVDSLGGVPMLVAALPTPEDVFLQLFLPWLLIGTAVWASGARLGLRARTTLALAAGTLVAVALHVFFKQIFALESSADFLRSGLAERTFWEPLLLGGGCTLWLLGARRAGHALAIAAAAHFGLYSLLLHNPFWAQQAVGSLPMLNLLPLAYGMPLLWLWTLARYEPALAVRFGRARAVAQMLLVSLLAFSLLRQFAVGSILSLPGLSPAEDIARSVLAIGLAIGFLLWGIACGSRDWRIASLVLMLGAVAKVFLFDASGLEGLMRIASFIALGFSLIGIGWLYSRHLNQGRLSTP